MKSKTLNIPNLLTFIRVLMVPFIVAIMMIDIEWFDILALVLFVLASLTDFVDGQIARKYDLVTNLGKLLDPLADKMMVISVLLVLVSQNRINAVPVIIIVIRELAVTGLRAVAATSQKGLSVIPASIWGKCKTFSQMITVILLIVDKRIYALTSFPIITVLVIVMTALTVISGVEYFVRARECLKD